MIIENNNMVTIYCIEDINGLKYVGSTKNKINDRLTRHRNDNSFHRCSSSKLNLHNCKIYSLETCNESERKEREKYWINNIECVNINKLNYDKNDDYQKQRKIELQRKLRQYQRGWGGDMRRNNNLLKIDISLFH